ncbi:hypothetical protein QBC38DRAFT_528673 [Podospora fimiseda]|uniref:Uncharacterized protein n=1 Tax=Podospora fimiseda TaxID=252190 RepID=A0AAN7BXR4_9PEZI|nr:hypothetical protein QBC38DRAFT_528673 [Podospora fimiseda]
MAAVAYQHQTPAHQSTPPSSIYNDNVQPEQQKPFNAAWQQQAGSFTPPSSQSPPPNTVQQQPPPQTSPATKIIQKQTPQPLPPNTAQQAPPQTSPAQNTVQQQQQQPLPQNTIQQQPPPQTSPAQNTVQQQQPQPFPPNIIQQQPPPQTSTTQNRIQKQAPQPLPPNTAQQPPLQTSPPPITAHQQQQSIPNSYDEPVASVETMEETSKLPSVLQNFGFTLQTLNIKIEPIRPLPHFIQKLTAMRRRVKYISSLSNPLSACHEPMDINIPLSGKYFGQNLNGSYGGKATGMLLAECELKPPPPPLPPPLPPEQNGVSPDIPGLALLVRYQWAGRVSDIDLAALYYF